LKKGVANELEKLEKDRMEKIEKMAKVGIWRISDKNC
jgi:hypothetical protein